ncbi:MAG: formylglycine-generating enzyme family protein [Bacteroidales bacterium]|jgi:formylglycine-generating enzyme required for sulfatase activity|nr:formylglycine-generating enzyme family protein [Bacteroidales bacterium]
MRKLQIFIFAAVFSALSFAQNSVPPNIERFTVYPKNCAVSPLDISVAGQTIRMIYVDGGAFTMGCNGGTDGSCLGPVPQRSVTSSCGGNIVHLRNNDETPPHKVTLNGFYIGQLEVTQALWTAVMSASDRGCTPVKIAGKAGADGVWPCRIPNNLGGNGNNNFPVYHVSWYDCIDFIKKLNCLTGLTFRLPTEAEWEYAARGGKADIPGQFSGTDNNIILLDSVAWWQNNSGKKSHEVGTRRPNELGIYDMTGNVWEWCNDKYNIYTNNATTNPQGPSESKGEGDQGQKNIDSGVLRVVHGGSWNNGPWSQRVLSRYGFSPSGRLNTVGFRLALVPTSL